MDACRREVLKLAAGALWSVGGGARFDVRSFGARGDGTTLDTAAVNHAIAAAAARGGGTVEFTAGAYLCHSIRLQSWVALHLGPGASIVAAPPGGFDAAEPDAPSARFQDFGHDHWHNSLIWGEGVHDVAILGPGLICGRGLARGTIAEEGLPAATTPGVADKAVALKRCHNVLLRDVSILTAGHFGILATAVSNLTLEDLTIDTNRDGINIDCCRNVRIAGCRVNSPSDDAICLKSSFALGEPRATENVTISDCHVTGAYAPGTLIDGTFRRIEANAGQPTGRIKCGTESNGGFRSITITNCVFESCRGFALETVDGGAIEDIIFSNVTMRDIRNAPFFLRLGARLRGPEGTGVGTLRRVIISNVVCDGPANAMPAIIAGIPGHVIEDIRISNIYVVQKGGGSAAMARTVPPEHERDYPEPGFLGPLPAQGLFVRHARNLELRQAEFRSLDADARPVVWLDDVEGASFSSLMVSGPGGAPAFRLRETRRLNLSASPPLEDTSLAYVADGQLP